MEPGEREKHGRERLQCQTWYFSRQESKQSTYFYWIFLQCINVQGEVECQIRFLVCMSKINDEIFK